MKIVSWNLNHRICEKHIPDNLVDLLVALDVDVVLLNEYVHGTSRTQFSDALTTAGFEHQLVSFTPARHNQVFAAAKKPFSLGDIAPPTFDGSAVSNLLHIKFDHTPIELVGLRVPAYEKAGDLTEYMRQLHDIMGTVAGRAIVFAGDINSDPFAKPGVRDALELDWSGCHGYRVPNPSGAWSYIN